MRSYLVLTLPGSPGPDQRGTIFVADRISWLAFFFPWIWLLTKRLWLASLIVLLGQLFAGQLMRVSGFEALGLTLIMAINVLIALEGRHFYSEMLIRRGWTLQEVILATDLETAEEAYFSGLTKSNANVLAAPNWMKSKVAPSVSDWARGGIGLFDHQGGR